MGVLKLQKIDNLSNIFDILNSTGLNLNVSTGGSLQSDSPLRIHKQKNGSYIIKNKNSAPIIFLSIAQFLKTFQETEKSLKLQLFK
jgi:hypothetical protein